MSLVNADTGEVVAECTTDEARQLTDRIRTAVAVAWELIAEAYQRQAHRALGYSSWDAYVAAEFGSARLRLPREERQEVVGSLREQGLSIRAIAAATGTHHSTVADDLARVGNPTPGEPEVDPRFRGSPAPKPAPPKPITGLDGKTYRPKSNPLAAAIEAERTKAEAAAAQRAEDREALAQLARDAERAGMDMDGERLRQRGEFKRLCRDLAALPAPAEFLARQGEWLSDTHYLNAEAALTWLTEFHALKEAS